MYHERSSLFKRCAVSVPWADVEGEGVEDVRVEVRFFDQTFILSVNIVIIDNQTLKLSINIDNWSLIDNQALRLSININNWTLIINNQPLIICGGLWSPSTVPCRMYDTEAGEIHSLVKISKTLRH